MSDESKFRKINSIEKNTNPLYVKGKISGKTGVGKYKNQPLAKAKLCDETGTIGITLWNEQAIDISDGDCIMIENGYSNEYQNKLNVQAGYNGKLRKISEQINCTDVETHEEIKFTKIKSLDYNASNVNVEGKLKIGKLIEDPEKSKLLGYLCDETGTIGITLWEENTKKFSDGDCIRIENGYVSTPGEPMLTEGHFGKVYRIDKNFDCEHKQDSTTTGSSSTTDPIIDEKIEKI